MFCSTIVRKNKIVKANEELMETIAAQKTVPKQAGFIYVINHLLS